MDFKYPYTDYHELNLDWFLSEFKNLVDTWARTQQDWISMQEYIRDYFTNLNVQTEIDNKINAMILDGTFGAIVEPFVTAALPALVHGELPDVVASQIAGVVAAQIDGVVSEQLPAVAAAAAAAEVGDWLAAHIDPDTGYVIDDTLTVSLAAADAKTTGDDIFSNNNADFYNGQSLFSTIKSIVDADTAVIDFHGVFMRGNAVGGNIEASTTRVYAKFPEFKARDKIYFDDTLYRMNVAHFVNGSYTSQSGWQSSSPFTSFTPSDYDLITLKGINDDDVVDINTAVATTRLEREHAFTKTYHTLYIATNGSDTNSGIDAAHPLATVNKALELGAERILIAPGYYQGQQIDLSKSKTGYVEICRTDNTQFALFMPSGSTITTSETPVSGYTKVYQASTDKTFAANNKWLFQRNNADAGTAITSGERLPQQGGRYYRIPNGTIIRKCSSATLADALSEMEASADYLWYYDSGNIYFTRPHAVNSTYPISYSDGTKLFKNGSSSNTVVMDGIDTLFMGINIDNTVNSRISNCGATFVYGDGAITYNNAQNATLIRCEACAAFNGSTGDGINAHGSSGSGTLLHKTTGVLIDCWSHDNNDDGFSDHENCVSEIYGCLFEYNGKGGVTPSYGSHCAIYNTISRKNYNGFFYVGEAADSGNGGQMLCVNCLAEDNTRGTSQVNAGFSVSNNGNTMILVNCQASGNNIGFNIPSNTTATMVNCTQLNNTTPIFGKTRTTFKNGSLVTGD